MDVPRLAPVAERHSAVLPYPHMPESAASGTLALLYGDIRKALGFVPHLFMSLALFPDYLPLAWQQSKEALESPEFAAAASTLARSAAGLVEPPADPRARAVLAGRASGRMLLLADGLRLGLAGCLPPTTSARPAASLAGAPVSPVQAALPEAMLRPTSPAYGVLRRALDTPLVNELWHLLADEGLLEPVWSELAPLAAGARAAAVDVGEAAERAARALAWDPVADPAALEAAGSAHLLPAIDMVLTTFSVTLSRVLALVASCGDEPERRRHAPAGERPRDAAAEEEAGI
jgi:hypothetical protein